MVGVVCRQTTLTEEEATERLAAHCGDPVAVIKEFMGQPQTAPAPPARNAHQTIFREINQFVESVSAVRLTAAEKKAPN